MSHTKRFFITLVLDHFFSSLPTRNMNTSQLYLLLCFFLPLISCEEDRPSDPISGTVRNAFTDEPIADAAVSLLENGPTTQTDANGKFRFDAASLTNMEEIVVEGKTHAALSLTHPDFHPREVNIVLEQHTEIEMPPKDVPVYFYYPPVKLNDGLATASRGAVGMDAQIIQNLMDKVRRDGYNELHSLLVYKDGLLVMEEYFHGNNDTIDFENNVTVDKRPDPVQWGRNDPHYVASVNKALTSTVVGIALDQQGLSVTDHIAPYLPEYEAHFSDANKAALNFEHCLTMTAGFQWDEWGSNDLSLLWQSNDFGDFVLQRNNMGSESEWRYNSALPNLLLKAVDNMVDGGVRSWAHEHFYEKLGITNYRWQSQPDGYPEGAARMYIRPRDMLKVGITYLNDGMWAGEQVIPKEWVAQCMQVKNQTASGDYSYYFWLREINGVQYLSADGDGGNYINIFPEQNMVIVMTQGLYLKWPSYVNQANNIMGQYILPAIE